MIFKIYLHSGCNFLSEFVTLNLKFACNMNVFKLKMWFTLKYSKIPSVVNDLNNTFCKSKYYVLLQDRWSNQFMGVVLFENHSWDFSIYTFLEKFSRKTWKITVEN